MYSINGEGDHRNYFVMQVNITSINFITDSILSMTLLSRANVIITDLPDLVPLMNMNIEENLGVLQGRISAKSLSWQVMLI